MTLDDLQKLPIGAVRRVKWINRGGLMSPTFGFLSVGESAYAIEWDDRSRVVLTRRDIDDGTAVLWAANLEFCEPNSVTVNITFSATLPPGYEATGEFRQPDPTVDTYIHQDGVTVVHPAHRGNGTPKGPRIILKRNLTVKERLEALREKVATIPPTCIDTDRIHSEISEILKLLN